MRCLSFRCTCFSLQPVSDEKNVVSAKPSEPNELFNLPSLQTPSLKVTKHYDLISAYMHSDRWSLILAFMTKCNACWISSRETSSWPLSFPKHFVQIGIQNSGTSFRSQNSTILSCVWARATDIPPHENQHLAALKFQTLQALRAMSHTKPLDDTSEKAPRSQHQPVVP